MKIFKKFLIVLAAFAFAFAFAGCGEYTPPSGDGGNIPPSGGNDPSVSPDPGDPALEDAFTVRLDPLIFDEARDADTKLSDKFWAGEVTKVQAQWTNVDTHEVYSANFDATGVAYRTDLDGDYFVTLHNLPDAYTYKSTDVTHNVTNNDRELTIELWPLRSLGTRYVYGSEHEPWYSIKTGAYRVSLGVGDKLMFNFKPSKQGEYVLETFADTVANEINPRLEVYNGNLPAYYNATRPFSEQDGGGAENTYTKNIKWSYELGASYVGNGLIFKLITESINPNAKKLDIDFILERVGDRGEEGYEPAKVVEVKETLSNIPRPDGTFTFCSDYSGILNAKNKGVLDSSDIALNPDDGFYHYYELVNGQRVFGATVYAVLGGNNYVHAAFGNASGTSTIKNITPYMETMFPLGYVQPSIKHEARNYISFVAAYVNYCNGDGAYPVTAELKEFLDYYARAARIFADGEGYAESTQDRPLEDGEGNRVGVVHGPAMNSDDESMWLYCCGLYR